MLSRNAHTTRFPDLYQGFFMAALLIKMLILMKASMK